jgi:4-carboxymuconolactone decarboxylase
MSAQPTGAQQTLGDFAPKLVSLTNDVLFGDVWERPGLSKRDRSLITVATLVALYRVEQLPFHLNRALENGVTKDELIEAITHLAFYAGWPCAMTAINIAQRLFEMSEHAPGAGG